MIGEIRDLETARIAIQASLTGHLVFSTLHTNSAIAAITRLIDIGLERYLLASTIAGVMAQRLVRKLCLACSRPHCGQRTRAWQAEMACSDPEVDLSHSREPVGCEACAARPAIADARRYRNCWWSMTASAKQSEDEARISALIEQLARTQDFTRSTKTDW